MKSRKDLILQWQNFKLLDKKKPNILFIVIDSLRNDQCHGNNRTSITPNIDKMISNGSYFSQTISSADGTILALNSVLTGLFQLQRKLGTCWEKYSYFKPNLLPQIFLNICKVVEF